MPAADGSAGARPTKKRSSHIAPSPSPTRVEGSNYTGYASSPRTSSSHSGFTPSPRSVEGSISTPSSYTYRPSSVSVEHSNPVSFLSKLFSASPTSIEAVTPSYSKPYSASPTHVENTGLLDFLDSLFRASPNFVDSRAPEDNVPFIPSPLNAEQSYRKVGSSAEPLGRGIGSPVGVEGMLNTPYGFNPSPLNVEQDAKFGFPSRDRFVEGSPYNPAANPVGDLPLDRQSGVNFPVPPSMAGSNDPMGKLQQTLGGGRGDPKDYTLYGEDIVHRGAAGKLKQALKEWFPGGRQTFLDKDNYKKAKPEPEGDGTSTLDLFGGGMFGEPGKGNAPDLTIPQASISRKDKDLASGILSSGGAAVGPENMNELIDNYEGNLFSKRFNRYLADQAERHARGEPTDSQEEVANKFLTGFQEFASPIEGLDQSAFTSDFGPRVHPITGSSSFHTGDDLSAAMGTPIRAVANGIVEQANSGDSIYGNQVILRHGNKKESMYGHMEKFVVAPGEKVKEGQIIGYVGSTGLSTGPHLHLETWNKGDPFDPTGLLQGADPQDTIPNTPYQGPPLVGGGEGNATSGASVPYRYQENGPAPNPSGVVPGSLMYGFAAPQPVQSSLNNPGGQLGAFLDAISSQESGGDYGAVGVPTGSGTALGKYQILDSNIAGPGGWDQETIGRDVTPEEFLNSPQLQDAIAMAKLEDYFKQYGPAGAAKAWYAGPGNAYLNSNSPQYGGPSVNAYAASVLAKMRGLQ